MILRKSILVTVFIFYNLLSAFTFAENYDFSKASILVSENITPAFRKTIVDVLQEEIYKRSQVSMPQSERWTDINIAVSLAGDKSLFKHPFPTEIALPSEKESFAVALDTSNGKQTLWIIGYDERGILFGVGHLLRTLSFEPKAIFFDSTDVILSAPQYPIRGHQLGYRNTANSYDGWSPEQYDQYIRELALFGANSIENIPLSTSNSAHMEVSPQEMNIHISNICKKYNLDYWVWVPVKKLTDEVAFREERQKHIDLYKNSPKLDNIFIPGGDPGDNHPKELLPFLETISNELKKYHPPAGIWLSLQGFSDEQIDYFYNFLSEKSPDWLRGVVSGPSSPSLSSTRYRLPDKYMHRHYPDITHTIRCQYPTLNWDQSFALTLGREPINPQPFYYANIHNKYAPFTDGFITYSDGINDDVNKFIWTRRGWDSNVEVTNIMHQYVRFFFGVNNPERISHAIVALEQNWNGPINENAGIEMTLRSWNELEQEYPQLKSNWRWQMCIFRANYDAYTRRRNLYEKSLEKEANDILRHAKANGINKAMQQALDKVNEADNFNIAPEIKQKIFEYADSLFLSISLQTSMKKYQASGAERGCMLDFLDYPLNNRWWLADEFKKIEQMATDEEKLLRIKTICEWENPGNGSYYDNISNIAESSHVLTTVYDATDFAWWDNGMSRKRLSTQLFQNFPRLEYTDLNPDARYLIRIAGYGDALLRVDGERITPVVYNKELETFKEFMIDPRHTRDGKISVTFDEPEESHLNWRQHSKICDIWLIKRD